jgi:hypothetical protein
LQGPSVSPSPCATPSARAAGESRLRTPLCPTGQRARRGMAILAANAAACGRPGARGARRRGHRAVPATMREPQAAASR